MLTRQTYFLAYKILRPEGKLNAPYMLMGSNFKNRIQRLILTIFIGRICELDASTKVEGKFVIVPKMVFCPHQD